MEPATKNAAPDDDEVRLYSIGDAADLLGVSPRYVYQLIADGALRKVKQGRRLQVRGDDLAVYIDARTEQR